MMKLIFSLGMILFFAGCSAFNSGGDLSRLSIKGSCAEGLQQDFAASFQPFLKTNCNGCHASGGVGKGAFADTNVALAFEEFQLRGFQMVGDRAVDPAHQSPYTGPQLQGEVDAMNTTWQDSLAQVSTCEDLIAAIPLPDDEPIPESATYTSVGKTVDTDDIGKTLSWDLSTEIELPQGTTRDGATFSVDIQTSTTATGEKSYLFLNPKLSTGGESLRVSYIEIYLNGEFMGNASTYRGINRYVPANGERDLSDTTMVVPFDFDASDELQIAFGILDPADFNPSTYTQISTNIFAQSCNSCHNANNAQGGLDLTSYDVLISQFIAIPYSIAGSGVYTRMTDANNPMPPAGLLPEASQNSVRDWIRDGAPE